MQERRQQQRAAEAASLVQKRLQQSAVVLGWLGLGVGAGYLVLRGVRTYQSRSVA